jgi:hypothetical protein
MKRARVSTFSETLNNISPLLAIRAWKKCAGPALLKKVQFLGVHKNIENRKVLRLGVNESVWMQELQYQKRSLCQRFNQALSELSFGKSELRVHECDIIYYTKKIKR